MKALKLHQIIESKAWSMAIIFVILFNAVLLGLGTSNYIKSTYGAYLNALDMLCLVFLA